MMKVHLFKASRATTSLRIEMGQQIAHVYSDLGKPELLVWASAHGLAAGWLQDRRFPHFDLWGSKLALLRGLHRVADREFVADVRSLRGG